MHKQRPGLRFVLPVAEGLRAMIEPLQRVHAGGTQVELLDGRSHEALAACDVALVASGTATLEAALFKRPMVITYNMHWLSWQMMKRMAYQPWVGLPNILLSEFAVPELLQDEATPARLAQAALAWLDDPARCATISQRFDALHRELRRNTAQAATDAIEKILSA
jgi:lipid-A-disaccharide synthase